jgi:tyrosyl-tRNA synthetase
MFASKGEVKRALKENSISLNKAKINDSYQVTEKYLLSDSIILVQKGKKNYYLVEVK